MTLSCIFVTAAIAAAGVFVFVVVNNGGTAKMTKKKRYNTQ